MNNNNFIQQNSPDGGFLQSEYWRKFQESAGRKTFHIEREGFWANIVEHELPFVGNYFYMPRGPVLEFPISLPSADPPWADNFQFPIFSEIIKLAKENNIGWIRFDPLDNNILELVKKYSEYKVVKAPHDMQPREIFVIDISASVENILARMKPKTRYNIRVAQKKGIKITTSRNKKCIDAFCDLMETTAQRDGIVSHPKTYYQKMIAAMPEDVLKLYCAEYQGKIIAANLVSFFGGTATYLHGASGNENRNVMAPYLLQWQAMMDAKEAGCGRYDFGGTSIGRKKKEESPPASPRSSTSVASLKIPWETLRVGSVQRSEALRAGSKQSNWEGITRFKTGFSPLTEPVEFLGSYDVALNPGKYYLYRVGQYIKELAS